MSPPHHSEITWSGSTRNDRERPFGASSANAGGAGGRSHSGHKFDSLGAGLGLESWEMHRVSRLRHAMQVREQHSDEEPFEAEAEPDITPGISHEDVGAH
jgi:hypothetical protein